ncbi:MAG: transglutaminase domain-containing protein, partial [Candidatus Kariarchaeaceae archaeon]
MSSAAVDAKKRKRRKRGVTRRVRDEKGNIVVKRYTKKKSRLTIPGLTWKKAPSLLLGTAFGSYATAAYLAKEGLLSTEEGTLSNSLNTYFSSELEGVAKLFLAGTLAVVFASFFGYSLITKGFKIRRWPAAGRQLIAIYFAGLILFAILSPFINEFGIIRQQDEKDFVEDDRFHDLSGLNAPFYSELLNGLLDLLGNIPDPSELVATILPSDGYDLDSAKDRYLWRWRVAEKYSDSLKDFEQGLTATELAYIESVYDPTKSRDEMRSFQVSEQYLTISSSYSGEALTTWHSENGATIGSTDDISVDFAEGISGNLNQESLGGYRDGNEQPVLEMSFDAPRTQGYVNYEAIWQAEDKESLSSNSVVYDDIDSYTSPTSLQQSNNLHLSALPDKFTSLPNTISNIWGSTSLPGGSAAAYVANDADGFFESTYNNFVSSFTEETSVYSAIMQVSDKITNEILERYKTGDLNIDPTQTSGVAPDGYDKAYWFYNALETGGDFGMKELLAGFTNMLRVLNIPARPIIGFSVGDFLDSNGNSCTGSNCDSIEVLFKHLHVWIEALIPWIDDVGQTHYSWGVFNPIPDPWLLLEDGTDIEYGRNALGGQPDIDLELLTGEDTPIPGGEIQGKSSFNLAKIEENVTGRVRVSYEGTPAIGQTVNLKLLTESDLQTLESGALDFTQIDQLGINLEEVVTTGADGWVNFSLIVERDNTAYQWLKNGTKSQLPGIIIDTVNPLGSGLGEYNVYALVAFFGIGFNMSIIGWDLDINIEITLDQNSQSIVNPETAETISAYNILFGKKFNATITVTNEDTDALEGIEPINLILLDQTEFKDLTDYFTSNDMSSAQTLLDNNKIGNFSATDAFGINTITVYGANYTAIGVVPDTVYVLIAHWEDTLKFGQTWIYFSGDITLSTNLNTHGPQIPTPKVSTSSGDVIWHVETNVTSFISDPLFPPEQAENVDLIYYVFLESYLDANNNTWGDL